MITENILGNNENSGIFGRMISMKYFLEFFSRCFVYCFRKSLNLVHVLTMVFGISRNSVELLCGAWREKV
jgi:hypothetical protein